ncbi:uncharacterized protein LOC136034764 [Artemia franciscana]|uniref:uncharacterized protein LOC136034764 n=1 Tax=Artemia franciscana TaxID=6661 RepID=UPI0032DADFAE
MNWLPKIGLFSQTSRAKRKACRPRIKLKDIVRTDSREIGTSGEVLTRDTLNRLEGRRSVRICAGLRRFDAAQSQQWLRSESKIHRQRRKYLLLRTFRASKRNPILFYSCMSLEAPGVHNQESRLTLSRVSVYHKLFDQGEAPFVIEFAVYPKCFKSVDSTGAISAIRRERDFEYKCSRSGSRKES